jgi:hypothetical protein
MMVSLLFNAVSTILLTATLNQSFSCPTIPYNHNEEDNLHQAHQALYVSSEESICNKYTSIILGSKTPKNQRRLMALFVNTALIDIYTTPNIGISVNGISINGIIWPGE